MDISGWQFTPFIIPALGAAIIAAALALYAWRKRDTVSNAWVFVTLTALTAWWSFTYALELATTDPETMLLWVKMEWISIALLPLATFLFALVYTDNSRFITLRIVLPLAIMPLVLIGLAWTTPAHTLLYANPGTINRGSFIGFEAQRGPAFYVHVVYSYILLLIALWLMVRNLRGARGEARRMNAFIITGVLLPMLANVVYQVAILLDSPIYIDLTLMAFVISAILFGWGWLRLRLGDLMPELRELALMPSEVDEINLAHSTQQRILNLVSIALALLLFLALVPILTILARDEASRWPYMTAYIVFFVLLLGVAFWRSGPYGLRSAGLAVVYLGLLILDVRINGLTPAAGMYMVAYAAFVAVLFPRRPAIGAVIFGVIMLLANPPAENPVIVRDINSLLYLFLSAFMTIGLLLVTLFALRRDSQTLLRRARELTRALDVERTQLEERVTARTRALETSATISRQLSTILDREELVREVVEQLRISFAYYHVHIFLWEEASGLLKMAGGTGDAGQAMLVMGHAIRPDQGLVGRAFRTNSPVVVGDVSRDPDWLPNRLLPGTRSEVAVPISYGGEVLGVIDAQDNEVNGLGQQDSQLLQIIAGQLAVALRNARLVAHSQQQAEQAALINTINQKIAQTIDMDGAIRVALAELTRALEAGSAAVYLEADGGSNGHG